MPQRTQEIQVTSRLIMISPSNFAFNEQTSASNRFQINKEEAGERIREKAMFEFGRMVETLRSNRLIVDVYEDTPNPVTPDAVFPNNWISFHESGKIILYPMMAENRRLERRNDLVADVLRNYQVDEVVDLSRFEKDGKFLEGTGSMVLDRRHSTIYACLSPRTDAELLKKLAGLLNYELQAFYAEDESGVPVYHTNVIMSLGETLAVICLEAITGETHKAGVAQALISSGREIVEITFEQVRKFAGNMLFVQNVVGEKLVVLSSSALGSLTEEQKAILAEHVRWVAVDLSTIELYGGGSARCMLAEQFLPVQV
jgi:hypothetical protein